jgi:hypothetical protein
MFVAVVLGKMPIVSSSNAAETAMYSLHCGQSEITGCCCQLVVLMGHSAHTLLCQATV